jgi:hypothetical protein
MNGLIAALLPIFVLWSIPLIPLIVTGIVSVLEHIRESPRHMLMARPALALKSSDLVENDAS